MKTRILLLAGAAIVLAAGCTNRMELTDANPSQGRKYSTHVRPVTNHESCKTCHSTDPEAKAQSAPMNIGEYAHDRAKRAGILRMFTSFDRVGEVKQSFTETQIKDVLDWIAVGAPDDSKTF